MDEEEHFPACLIVFGQNLLLLPDVLFSKIEHFFQNVRCLQDVRFRS